MALKTQIFKTTWLRILCAIMLVCVSFAHQPVFSATSTDLQEFSEYVLPDGSMPVICISDWDGDDNSHPVGQYRSKNCEACRLSSAIVLPASAAAIHEPIPQKLLGLALFDDALFSATLTHDAAPRAPPILLALL